nr:MAG TPA: hypothetical protein [Caudoviricetes sp.]
MYKCSSLVESCLKSVEDISATSYSVCSNEIEYSACYIL